MAETWTIRRVLDWTRGYLERHGDEHPRLSAEWLLSAATDYSRVELYLNYDKPLTKEELAKVRAGIERRAKGEPLQYVTGEMPFRHIVLRCERGVLIPRPETEVLVDAALEGVDAALARREVELADAHGEREDANPYEEASPDEDADPDGRKHASPVVRVLDLCTGTGCIACSIASERDFTQVVATDISQKAVALATRNADALGLAERLEILCCDLAADVDEGLLGTFDLLVSNPPYIPTAVLPTLPEEVVGFEPSLALDGGADGLDLFRRILDLAPVALASGGMLAVELFEENVRAAADLCREQGGWAHVEVREDLTHRPRVLVAVREG